MATGTASGKTLVYNLAFAEAALTTPKATALYLFPTKALARDQLRAVRALKLPQLKAAVYDGDTPQAERPLIRTNANLVMTNPDMLHLSLLADHARWADFFLRLSLVVVDEAHVCRGVFGSHVAMVLRRLRRLVAHYGGDPAAGAWRARPSATRRELAEPARPASTSWSSRPTTPRRRARSSSRCGTRRSSTRRPARGGARSPKPRGSSAGWSSEGARTIGFTRSRRAAELLAEFTRRELGDAQLRGRGSRAYRAGYLAEDRRAARAAARGRRARWRSPRRARSSSGIDIGSLDAAVLTGYPGTRASMWQQAGRAGRRDAELARGARRPGRSARPVPRAPPRRPVRQAGRGRGDRPDEPVRAASRTCAAPHGSMPLADDELATSSATPTRSRARPTRWPSAASSCGAGETLARSRAGSRRTARVDIRAGGGHVYSIVIEEHRRAARHRRRAPRLRHAAPGRRLPAPGRAVPRAGARPRRSGSRSCAQPTPTSTRRPATSPTSRSARYLTRSRIGDVGACASAPCASRTRSSSYVRKLVSRRTRSSTSSRSPLPPVELETARACGGRSPRRCSTAPASARATSPGAIHAAEHAAIGLLPARRDVRPMGHRRRVDPDAPGHRAHDDLRLRRLPGRRRHRRARVPRPSERWLRATLGGDPTVPVLARMPGCVQSPKCGNGNEPLDKQGAVALLAAILGERWG